MLYAFYETITVINGIDSKWLKYSINGKKLTCTLKQEYLYFLWIDFIWAGSIQELEGSRTINRLPSVGHLIFAISFVTA